jgi:glucose/mannose-6-phosphate isomerase
MQVMDHLITAFPNNITDALKVASSLNFKQPDSRIENILICGMGGSGIGGKIVSQWIESEISIPVQLLNDYTIPACVGEKTLVVGCSYSGNTEETLEAIESARLKGAHIICICSGGTMEKWCAVNKFECVIVPGGNPPRSALAFSLVHLMNIFVQLGFISDACLNDLELSAHLLEQEKNSIHEEAKEIAAFLYGKVGVIYSGPQYEGVAVRARQQLNENSKYLCWHHTIPEMNHNELVGWGGGDDRFAVLMLNSGDLHPKNQKRFDISKEVVTAKSFGVKELHARGTSYIQRSMYFIHVIDWASSYLCKMNQVDIMDIKVIDYLKGELANFN